VVLKALRRERSEGPGEPRKSSWRRKLLAGCEGITEVLA
jgi:hypothetical protein